MKKIALLLTILCAGQLYGMENPNQDGMAGLPPEVQVLIIQALKSGNDLDAVIKGIKNASEISKSLKQIINAEYGDFSNLKGFTALAHMLAKKFPKENPKTIAEKF